jgi:hypothetical protein
MTDAFSTSTLKLQELEPAVIGIVVGPWLTGVPDPVRTIDCKPVPVNVPDPEKVIPFTTVVLTFQSPAALTFTSSSTELEAVSAVPFTYSPSSTALEQLFPVAARVNTAECLNHQYCMDWIYQLKLSLCPRK